MIDAIESALTFTHGRSRSDLDNDQMLLFALVRAIEIIGEAASKVSVEGRAQIPDVPWGVIVGMRNRLIHAYFDIDPDTLWSTVKRDLPPLLAQINSIQLTE